MPDAPPPGQEQPESFWHYIGRALLVIVPIALLMMGLAWSGFLYRWEMLGLDPLLRFDTFKDPDVRIVQITDNDYINFFYETSPLNRGKLETLITTIAKAGPKLLVIDLDVTPTQAEKNKLSLPTQIQNDLRSSSNPNLVVIWPQTVERPSKTESDLILQPLPKDIPEGHLGIPLFPRESDGTVRGFLRYVPVNFRSSSVLWPSMPWAAFRGGSDSFKSNEYREEPEKTYFNFSGDRYAFDHTDAASILSRPKSADFRKVFGGKTVIVGGDFTAARDEYFTPIGPIPGVDLIAYALETEIRGGGMRPLQEVAVFFIDVLLGCLIASLAYQSKHPIRAVAIGVGLAIILPFVGSYLVFHSWNLLVQLRSCHSRRRHTHWNRSLERKESGD